MRRFLFCAILLSHGAAAAEATGDYARDLGTVYAGYQRLVAMKEACDAAVPPTRPRNGEAWGAWQARERALIEELQRRVNTLIRLASEDEKAYVRNLGKYEGAILQEREAYRVTLLALDPAELKSRCERFPEVLSGPGGNLGELYASELAVIRRRPEGRGATAP